MSGNDNFSSLNPSFFWRTPPQTTVHRSRGLHFPQQLSPGVSTFTNQVVEGLALHLRFKELDDYLSHRIHGAAIYGNMDPINIPPINVSIYIPAPWILWVWDQ